MIVVEDLYKHYRVHQRPPGLGAALRSLFVRPQKVVRAVDGISFRIDPGERVGFLGPNGAGKTTTLKVLSGLLHPSKGDVRVLGHVPARRDAAFLKQIMLVTGQKQQLLWDLPPAETFELNRAVYEVPATEFRKSVAELTELLELGDLIHVPTRQLSLGERMKCELVAALVHRPSVLFLDEPTIGLDVSMQTTIRRFIAEYNQRYGATVLLTSHYMDDVTALCPRVIVIDRGVLSYDGDLDELVRRVRPEKLVVLRLRESVAPERLLGLGKLVEHAGTQVVLQVDKELVSQVVVRALSTLPVEDLNVEGAPLEEVMSELFTRGKRDRPARPSEDEA
ncbi:MAG TPA: ATP-binding cassette domain-containing protein [Polyangiaceae bacterium]|nr:ATP-binding cassette domain-containing protein [Polyangiaceae bacterium]